MKVFRSPRDSLDYTLYEYPIWYIKRKRLDFVMLGLGCLLGFSIIFLPSNLTPTHKNIIWASTQSLPIMTIIMQLMRHKLLKDLENDPLRCDCGGRYVDPDELGFVSDGYYLICDNDDVGDGWACEKQIVNPSIASDKLGSEDKA